MARSLNFEFGGKAFALELIKVDRSKIYGDVAVETFDDKGRKAELVTLARDGRTIISTGGTASGYIDEDGEWVEREGLTAVNANGEKLNIVPATFDLTTKLDRDVTIESYLDHEIRLSYVLEPGDVGLDPAFEAALKAGKIFEIDFSYRGGSFADPAFILGGDEGTIWLMIGEPGDVEYVGYSQAAICAANAQSETESDDDSNDAFDFDMM
jgi:hypothetical protein